MSDVDPRIAYLESRTKYETARKKAEEVIKIVRTVAGYMEQYQLETFIAVNFTDQKSSQKTSALHFRIDWEKWPSAAQIKAALVEMEAAHKECRDLWGAIPRENHSGLTSPPSRVGDRAM